MEIKKVYSAIVRESLAKGDNSGIHNIVLCLPERINSKPGQFISLESKVGMAKIWRPFSVVKAESGDIEIIVQAVGPNTKEYAELKKGDNINMVGPLGKPIFLEPDKKDYIFVGGGIGTAGLLYTFDTLMKAGNRPLFLQGAKTAGDLFGYEHFQEAISNHKVIAESGKIRTGFVTDFLLDELEQDDTNSTVIACGPPLMLKAVHKLCQKYGNECIVLVEEMMLCGTGSCKGCAIWGFDENGNDEVKHVCQDGPAFDAEWVNWEKFIPKIIPTIISCKSEVENPMATTLHGVRGNIKMDSPIINASGCLGLKAIKDGSVDISCLGALVTKTVTLPPKLGNPLPRTAEVPGGALNAIGLENSGLKVFRKDELPVWLDFGKPVIVNISGNSIKEFVDITAELATEPIAGIEVNVSCPNVKKGLTFGSDPNLIYKLIKAIRGVSKKMLIIVKLTPNVTNIVLPARAAVQAGADVISAINTLQGMAIDIRTGRPKVSTGVCGYSGPGIHPIALAKIYQLAQADLGVPIIGIGGVIDTDSAAQFIIGGASAIGVGTGSFGNRDVFTEIYDGLDEIRKKRGASCLSDLIGTLVV